MKTISLLVELRYPCLIDADMAVEQLHNAIEYAINDGQFMVMAGQSMGPNPPYECNPELQSVTAEMED
jgi:hypothetical protein